MQTDKSTQLLCVWQNCLPQKVFNRIETCQRRLKYRVGLDKRMFQIHRCHPQHSARTKCTDTYNIFQIFGHWIKLLRCSGLILSIGQPSKSIYLFLPENCKPAPIHHVTLTPERGCQKGGPHKGPCTYCHFEQGIILWICSQFANHKYIKLLSCVICTSNENNECLILIDGKLCL